MSAAKKAAGDPGGSVQERHPLVVAVLQADKAWWEGTDGTERTRADAYRRALENLADFADAKHCPIDTTKLRDMNKLLKATPSSATLTPMPAEVVDVQLLRAACWPLYERIDAMLRAEKTTSEDTVGDGGPAKVLDAVCRAILKAKGKNAKLAAGDETTREAVLQLIAGVPADKASQYLTPSAKLCTGGWIKSDNPRVILTEKGARDGELRLARKKVRQ